MKREPLALLALAALVIVGMFLLAVLGKPIDPQLWVLSSLVVGGAVGIARQTDTPVVVQPPLPALLPPAPAILPASQPSPIGPVANGTANAGRPPS